MNPIRAAAITSAVGITLLLSACGDDDDTSSTPPQPLKSAPAKPSGGGVSPDKAPASAGDKRPPAPDDAISKRPGGPSQKSKPKAKTGKQQTGGVSPAY